MILHEDMSTREGRASGEGLGVDLRQLGGSCPLLASTMPY